jgi:hypothetical protein
VLAAGITQSHAGSPLPLSRMAVPPSTYPSRGRRIMPSSTNSTAIGTAPATIADDHSPILETLQEQITTTARPADYRSRHRPRPLNRGLCRGPAKGFDRQRGPSRLAAARAGAGPGTARPYWCDHGEIAPGGQRYGYPRDEEGVAGLDPVVVLDGEFQGEDPEVRQVCQWMRAKDLAITACKPR